MSSRRFSFGRPRSLIRLDGGAIALRLTSASGETIAMRLRPMTLQDARTPPRRFRQQP
jgi:hypothetical protein